MDETSGKIVHSEFISKRRASIKGNFQLASKNMEAEGVRIGIMYLKEYSNCSSYVHDKDNRNSSIIENNWGIEEKLDLNHIGKALAGG